MSKLIAMALLGFWTGCATRPVQEQVDEIKTVVPSFYTLKEGQKVENKLPLPDMTKIMVQWTYSDGGKRAKEGFRGWDFDHDGRFEMLEVLDPAGKAYMWAYDFDGDHVVDAVEQKLQNQVPDLKISSQED